MNAEIKKLNYLQALQEDIRTLRTENAELKVLNKGNQAIIKDLTKDLFEMDDKKKEAEEALANALIADERIADADAKMVNKMERILELEVINEEHKKLNGKLQNNLTIKEQELIEMHADNKKLAQQVDDYINQLRKAGTI